MEDAEQCFELSVQHKNRWLETSFKTCAVCDPNFHEFPDVDQETLIGYNISVEYCFWGKISVEYCFGGKCESVARSRRRSISFESVEAFNFYPFNFPSETTPDVSKS